MWQGTRRWAAKVWHWFGMFCAAMFIPVFGGLMVVGILFGEEGGGEGPSPASTPAVPSPSTRIDWTFLGTVCADGWPSDSIGSRGACSHHGGVAGSYRGSDGSVLVCRNMPPRTVEELDRQMAEFGRAVC